MSSPDCQWSYEFNLHGDDLSAMDSMGIRGPVELLNDDCLKEIFLYLSLRDRIRAERVCKQWQRVSLQMWRSVRKLHFCGLFNFCNPLTRQILNSFLKKTGETLEELDLSHVVASQLGPNFPRQIGYWCKNLKRLNLSHHIFSNTSLCDLASNLSNLKKLILRNCKGYGNKGLCHVLKANQGLEYLDISEHHHISSKGLFYVGNNLKVLIALNCPKLGGRSIKVIAQRNPEIEQLVVSNLSDEALTIVTDTCKNLKTLKLLKTRQGNAVEVLHNLSGLESLEHLYLPHQSCLDDAAISRICKSCVSLTEVSLSSCSEKLTDISLKYLSFLQCLRLLRLNYLEDISDAGLKELGARAHALRDLEARHCLRISDEGCRSLLESLPNFAKLDVSGCTLVSCTLLDSLNSILSSRSSTDPLLLLVYGTGILREDASRFHSPNVKICLEGSFLDDDDFEDGSRRSYRPDELGYYPVYEPQNDNPDEAGYYPVYQPDNPDEPAYYPVYQPENDNPNEAAYYPVYQPPSDDAQEDPYSQDCETDYSDFLDYVDWITEEEKS